MSLQDTIFSSFGYRPRSGSVGSYSNFLKVFKERPYCFPCNYITLHSYHHCTGFQFLHILINIITFFYFLIIAILKDMRWHLIGVLFCIYLIIRDVLSTFSCAYYWFTYLLWREVYSSSLPIFEVVCLYCWVLGFLHMFCIFYFFHFF